MEHFETILLEAYNTRHKFDMIFQDSLDPMCSCSKTFFQRKVFQTLFSKKNSLWVLKFEQWRKKWIVVSIETTIHFFLHCSDFNTQREFFFDKIATIDANVLTENKDSVVNTLLFGKPNSENSFNEAMLNASIEFILSTERFNNHYSNAN